MDTRTSRHMTFEFQNVSEKKSYLIEDETILFSVRLIRKNKTNIEKKKKKNILKF